MTYYLGLDGGGSKTTCVVGDESAVLGTAVSGPSNVTRVGEAQARESLHRAITEACAAARIDPAELRCSCIGAAGAGRKENATLVRTMVAEAIPGEIDVVGDMRIALQAAFGPGPGVIVISGTGSIAFGRDAQGQTARAGGWGFAISDEGSAHWIGRTAVAAVLRAADRLAEDPIAGQTSALFREISAAWEVGSCEELAMRANKLPNFAELLRGVVAAADASDDLAQEVLRNAGKELAQLAEIVLGRLFPEGGLQTHVAFAGGVFRHASLAREVFCRAVQATHPNVILNYEVVEPVHGALQLARNSER